MGLFYPKPFVFSNFFVSVQVSILYNRTDSTVAVKRRTFILRDRSDIHIFLSLWQALQAKAFLTCRYFSVLYINPPCYFKFLTSLMIPPSNVESSRCRVMLLIMASVFFVFICNPTLFASTSTLCNNSCAYSISCESKAISSANDYYWL